MPAAPVTMPADPVAATRRKLARLLAVGALRAAAGRDAREDDERADLHQVAEAVAEERPGA